MPDPPSPPLPLPADGEPGDLREPIRALSQFYRAFNRRDLEQMEAAWEHSADTSVISPVGGLARGWAVLRAGYERGFRTPTALTTEFFDYTLQEFGALALVIGRERGEARSPTGSQKLEGQATNILRRGSDGRWRMLHHHVSVANLAGLLGEGASPAPGPSRR